MYLEVIRHALDSNSKEKEVKLVTGKKMRAASERDK